MHATTAHPLGEGLSRFLVDRRIDSYPKVWFLLFLWQRTDSRPLNREFARSVTFSDEPTLDEIIDELEDTGLLHVQGGQCSLRRGNEIDAGLTALLHTFEDPLARRQLLSRLYRRTAARHD